VEKLSITIITYNEEKNIDRCLRSVQWADEIVVLDSFSTDRTVEICQRYGVRVEQETWQGYGKQKNLCAALAKNRWILNLDADEEVSPEGAEEIKALLREKFVHRAYDFPRKNFFGKRWIRYGGWYPDRIIRLYDKLQVRFSEGLVHEKLFPDDDVGSLREPLIHHSFTDMEDYVRRQNRYSTLYALEKSRAGWKAGWTHLCLRPPWMFLKTFFLRQGFREGFLGLFIAAAMAFYTFLKYAKTRSIDAGGG